MSTSTQFPPEVLARVSPEVLASMCKVRVPGGIRPLRLWPKQREIIRALEDPDTEEVVILKARQTGVTQIVSLYALSRAIRIAASHSLIVSKGDREAQEASGRVRQMYASLPEAVKRHHGIYHKNLEEFRLKHPDLPEPQDNLEDAITCDIRNLPAGAGRSYSSDLLLADEFDHWTDAEIRMADIQPTLAPGGKLAIASTANGYGGPLHVRWIKAKADPKKVAIFVGALDRPGRTQAWVQARRDELGGLGPQEFPLTPEEAFVSTGHNVFEPEHVKWQTEHIVQAPGGTYEFDHQIPAARLSREGRWLVWEVPVRGRRYLVAADPAGGGPHSDPSAAAVYDLDSGLQVAAYHGRPLPHEFGREIAAAGSIYGRALLVPEANNHGQAVIAHLSHLGYNHIYQQERFTVSPGTNKPRKEFGWLTTNQSKQLAVDAMRTQLRERTIGIRDADAIEEMMRFAEIAPGRYAGRGGHDDRVSAHTIAAAILSHSPRAQQITVSTSNVPTREPVDIRAGY